MRNFYSHVIVVSIFFSIIPIQYPLTKLQEHDPLVRLRRHLQGESGSQQGGAVGAYRLTGSSEGDGLGYFRV